MKKTKKLLMLAVLLILVTGCAVPTLKNGEQKVASLDKGGISADALYSVLKTKYGAEQFVDLLDKEILSNKYEETDDEKEYISSQIKELKESAEQNNASYEQLLSYYGFKKEKDLKEYLRLNYRRDLAVNEEVEKTLKKKEIKKYYEDEIYGDIKLKHILISPNTTDDMSTEEKESAEADAKKKAEDIIKKLEKGEDFSKLAKKYSDDSSNAKKGGDLGWVSTGDMVEEFDAAAFKLKKGKYTTSPVKTTYGYHIIYKVDEKAKPKLSKVRDEIVDALVSNKLKEDATLYYTSLEVIRKDAGLKFEDTELKKLYNTYISNQKSQAKSSESSSN
ncbi:MAG: peptidylprolyl isomerase [bacterium]|nr:peptidylprolyl isomerase [bacterium]